jgi:site-specific recombinase XerD
MNTLPAHLDRSGVEAHVDRLEQLADAVAEYQAAARAPSTRRAYQADVEDWQRWAVRMRCPPWPADGRAVAVYLAAGAKSGLSVATLNRRLSALKAESRDRRLAAPEGPELAEVWAGIRRTHGRPPRQKRALVVKDLRKVVGKLPAGLQGVRDRALLLIGFAAALRRSELVALELDVAGAGPVRLAFVGEGAEIRIDRSKADQEGRGAVVAVPFGGELCPVAAVEAWIKAAGLRAGPVFRAIDKGGRVSAEALSDRSVALIVKRACEGAGLNPSGFAGHSLRAGLVTSAAEAGAGLDEIMETSRHAKVETVLKYVRSSKRMKRAVSKRVGL